MKTEQEKELLICSYSDYDRTGYDIEVMYENCVDNQSELIYKEDEEIMTKQEFVELYEDSTQFYEWESDMWDCIWEDLYNDVCYEADKILGMKDYVKVEGFSQRWNGSRSIRQIIRETELEDIIKKYLNPDMLEVDVYEDRVEIRNIHHDGTNRYTLTPFSYGDLKKSELLALVDKESYEWYGDKLYKATKDDLINYLNDNLE